MVSHKEKNEIEKIEFYAIEFERTISRASNTVVPTASITKAKIFSKWKNSSKEH